MTLLVVIALVAPWAVVVQATSATATGPVEPVRQVRALYTNEFGLPRPMGIAHDVTDDVLLVAGSAAESTALIMLDGDELLGSPTSLPAGDPGTLALDPATGTLSLQRGDDLLTVPSDDTGAQPAVEPLAEAAVDPAGATVDGDGTRIVLDADGPALLAEDAGTTSAVSLDDLVGVPVRGLAYNAADGLLYVGSPDEERLYGVDTGGEIQTVRDYADTDIVDLQAMVFAPSTDSTDDPSTTNLFVADAGDDQTLGGVTEVTMQEASSTDADTSTSTLIQMIDTSLFDKPSPDPSGVTYLPDADRLLLVDSEVEEVTGAGQTDTNLWQLDRAGTVDHSGSVLAYSDEPTGVDYDVAGDRLFVTDDTQDRIYIVSRGGDGLFGTADDGVAELRPGSYGATDTEDPAFDPVSGDLFFLDGVSAEVYRIDPGNGVFGDGDDVVTHFDIGQHGILDSEALALHPDRGTLLVGERAGSTKSIYEITMDGQLVQVIDVSGVTGLRRISGLAYAPSSPNPAVGSLWVADRGVDNDADPEENDGRLFELSYPEGGNNPPTVTVTAPPDGTAITGGEAATFEAEASDPEDGDLTAAVTWRSDIDGALGSGGQITVTLSSGTHRITASVTDADGVTASATISVVVSSWPPMVQITAPEDGARVPGTDPVVLEATATDPEDGDLASASGYAFRRGGPVLGTSSESPNTPGPFVDGNDNLYFFNESDGARAAARKSTDGGDTWVEVDHENRPVINDLESIDAVAVGHTLYLFNNEGDRGHLHAFNMSSHPTAPDRWVVRDEPVEEGYAYNGEQQTGALEHRSDGTLVAFYNKGDDGQDRLYYRVRSASGSWGPVRDLEVEAGTEWLSVTTVVGRNDRIHVFYRGEGDAEGLHHRSLDTNGTLSERELVSADVSHVAWPMAGAVARVEGTTETVQVVYHGGDDRLYAATVTNDGPPEAPVPVNDEPVATGETHGSHQVVATVDMIGDRTVVVYADAATRDVWFTTATGDDGWSSPQELLDEVNVFWVRGHTFLRQGSTQFGFVFDEHSGGRANRGTYAALWPRGTQWHSDLDGLLGVGTPLTTMLSADATHRITAAVTDSDGVTRSDAITLHVEPAELPVLVTNAGLSVDEGATGTIGQEQLETEDAQSPPSGLTYRLDAAPSHGQLTRADRVVATGGTFSQADVDADRVAYTHDGGETLSDGFAFTVTDEDGNSVSDVFAITVMPVNDPPVVTVNAGLTMEEGGAETIGASRLSTSDEDADAADLVYTLDTAPTHGVVRLDGPALTAGDTFTQADIDAGRLTYAHDGSETVSDGFAFTVSDGSIDVSDEFAITITLVEDRPVVEMNTGLTVPEDGAGTIDADRLATADPDTDPADLIYTLDTAPTHGVVRLDSAALTAGDTFTQADIDAGRLAYAHDGSETVSDGFGFTVSDGSTEVSDEFAITITPVDDPPVLWVNAGLTVAEGADDTIGANRLATTDPDTAAADLTYSVDVEPGHGTLRLDGVALTLGETFTQADVDAGGLVYAHDGSESGSDAFAFTVTDGTRAESGVFEITITAVNDPPVVAVNTGLTVAEGSSRRIGASRLATTDPDTGPAALVYTLDMTPRHGRVRLAGVTLAVGDTFTQADIDAGRLSYAHDGSETVSDGFALTVTDGTTAVSDAFAITVTPVDDPPVVWVNTGLTLPEDGSGTIGASRLATTDHDTGPADLGYTVDRAPAHGLLTRAGNALAAGSTFTQSDIDHGRLAYAHDSSRNLSDGFAFTVTDGTTAISGDFVIRLEVVAPSAPTVSVTLDLQRAEVTFWSPEAVRYEVHHAVNGGRWTHVTTTTQRRVVADGLAWSSQNAWRVRAFDADGDASAWRATRTVTVVTPPEFDDVPSSHTFHDDIAWLGAAGITKGCNPPDNTRYCPDAPVTRGQMAAFLVRALGLSATSADGRFLDVPLTHTFATDINRLATAGITKGCNPPDNTRYCPDAPVTRGQMAAFVTRALRLSATSAGGRFLDVPLTHTFATDINRLATAGITKGCNPPDNTRYCPDAPVTRGQMAAFLHRALG